jgi:hypothetical protein
MRSCSLILALYFGLLSLAPHWQGLEFFKLDALIQHYAQFQQEKEQNSFLSFVQEHYLQQVNDSQQEHRQLPFKSASLNATVTLFMPLDRPQVIFEVYKPQQIASQIVTPPTTLTNNDFFEFWHPPQLV